MARSVVVASMLAGLAACAADTIVLKGGLSWTSSGIAQVSECGSKRVVEFGTMASSPYFRFLREYEERSSGGTTPMLVEVQGVPRASSDAKKEVLEYPRVLALTPGICAP